MTITGDWAEGDPLTPTNLSSKGGGNFPDRTYNAGWKRFGTSAVAKETRLQTAINQAATDGIPTVFVPASMLPYDASAVTFNPTVRMIREGQSNHDEWDIRAYGADGTFGSSQDDHPCIQAVFDGIYSLAIFGQTVRMPMRDIFTAYRTSKPIWIKYGKTRILGGDAYNPHVTATFAAGPTFFVGSGNATVPNIVPALATGPGSAWKMVNDTTWFNLRDAASCDLHGRAAFTVRCFFNSTSGVSGVICGSRGRWLANDAVPTCFILDHNADGKFHFVLTTSVTGLVGVTGTTTIVPGTTYHVEATYDGSNVRLFVNGVQEGGNVAATGTLVQSISEDVTVGPAFGKSPEQGYDLSAARATIDSLELADVARDTVNFPAPSAKHVKDSHTLALLNFVTQYGPFTAVDTNIATGGGIFWAWCRQQTNSFSSNFTEFDGLYISPSAANTASGIAVNGGSQGCIYSRLSIQSCRYGIFMPFGDTYFWRGTDIELLAGNTTMRYGIMAGGNAGLGTLTNFRGIGGVLPLTLLSPAIVVSGGWYLADGNTVFEALFGNNSSDGAPFIVNGMSFATESGVGNSWRATVAIGLTQGVYGTGAIFNGCTFEEGGNAPFAIADTQSVLEWDGCTFNVTGNPTSIVHQQGTAAWPMEFRRCTQAVSAWRKWSDVAGTAIVGKLGKLTAIAFATPLTLDCSLRDDFELGALTGAITINFSNVTPGQKISLWTVQNGGGGNAITFGTVNGTGAVKGATANDTASGHWSQYLFDANLNGNMTELGFKSGA